MNEENIKKMFSISFIKKYKLKPHDIPDNTQSYAMIFLQWKIMSIGKHVGKIGNLVHH